jgi:hypothetical protein
VSKAAFHFVEKYCQNSSDSGVASLAGDIAQTLNFTAQRAPAPIRSENPPP